MKVAWITVLIMIGILVLLELIILLPPVQRKLKTETEKALHKQLNADISIGAFRLGFPKTLKVQDILIAGDQNDTLAYLGEFSVNIGLLPLIRKQVVLQTIALHDGKGDIGKLLERIPADTTSSEMTTPADTASGTWKFSILEAHISSSYFKYRDESITGFELILDLGNVFLKFGTLDFENLLAFQEADIRNTMVSYELLDIVIPEDDDTTYSGIFDIRIKDADLTNAGFYFIDSTGIIFYAGGEQVDVDDLLVDIDNAKVAFSNGYIKKTTCSVDMLPSIDATEPGDNDYLDWGQYLWRIEGDEMMLDQFNMKINSIGEPDPAGHFNSDHLNFLGLSGSLRNITLDADTLNVQLENITGTEQNGLAIKQLNGNLFFRDSLFIVSDLNFKTAAAQYLANIKTTASPTDYTDIQEHYLDLQLNIESNNLSDIDYFYPLDSAGIQWVNEFQNNDYKLKTHITGTSGLLRLSELDFSYLDSTRMIVNGIIERPFSPDSIRTNLNIPMIFLSRNDIAKTISLEKSDANGMVPGYLEISGTYHNHGTEQHFTGDMSSDIGSLNQIDANVIVADVPYIQLAFNARLQNIDALSGEGFESMDFNFTGEWTGDDPYKASTRAEIEFDSLVYKGNLYQDIELSGKLDGGIFQSQISAADTSLQFEIGSNGKIDPERIIVSTDMDLKNIDLQKLQLFKSPLSLQSELTVDFTFTNEEDFSISTDIQKLDFQLEDTLYQMHSIQMAFETYPGYTGYHLDSYFYNLDFACQSALPGFIDAASRLPGYYLADPAADTIPFGLPEFDVKGRLDYPEAFARLFFPDLPSFSELIISGSYSDLTEQVLFQFEIPELAYESLYSDTLRFNLKGDHSKLNYNLNAGLKVDDMLQGVAWVSGAFRNSILTTRLKYTDSYSDPYLDISLKLDTLGNSVVLQFIKDSLIFSYDPWEINPENRIVINPEFVAFSRFDVTSEGQGIHISTPDVERPRDIRLQLKNFGMGSIEQLMNLDTLVYGTANADIHFNNLFGSPVIDGRLVIDSMSLSEFHVGQFNLSRFRFSKDTLDAKLTMTGPDEEIQFEGMLLTPENQEEKLAIKLEIGFLEIDQLNYLLSDYIKDASGNLKGNLEITGSRQMPLINGRLGFNDAQVGIVALNNTFSLGNDRIEVNHNEFRFDHFLIRNSKNQEAEIVGSISLADGGEIYHNLKIITENMEIMNSTKKENDILYGLLMAQTDIEVSGPSSDVKVNAAVKIDRTSDITYTFPDELALNDHEGIVSYNRFDPELQVDEDIEEATGFLAMPMLTDFKSRIEIEDGAAFNLYFDNGGSDYLKATLDGFINYNLVEDNAEVSGMFRIGEGTLHYAVPMVTVEEYNLEPGSFITLSNDVYNPFLKIIASSTVRASTEGLMPSNPKVMDFVILLYLEGELNDLKLRFDISPETSDALVSARLSQLTEEERNVNALNLLVRGSFILSLHGDELGSTSTANAQIDKFYATHLNHLISENISFVDLKFDVQSFRDYSETGESVLRRNYYYNIGKNFLDDRARINYKGSLGTSYAGESEQVNSQFVQNELEIELKITPDGTFRGVFFRKNKYEGLLEGEIIETGGGLRISKEFYSLGDVILNERKWQQLKRRKLEMKKLKDKQLHIEGSTGKN